MNPRELEVDVALEVVLPSPSRHEADDAFWRDHSGKSPEDVVSEAERVERVRKVGVS